MGYFGFVLQEGWAVPLFKYTGIQSAREDYTESGTVLAQSEEEAKKKLKALQFDRVHVKRLGGIKAIVGRFIATVR